MIFITIYQPLIHINPKIKIAKKFMFNISSSPILTMISDTSFIDHLPQVMPKLVPKFPFQTRL